MKSDINPNRPTWKPRTLRTIVHRGARVHVNKMCAAIVGALLAPQPGAWMCLLNPVVLFKSSAKPQIKWWKKRWMSVKGVQSFVSFLCAQHKCDPVVTAALVWLHSSLAAPGVAIPECCENFWAFNINIPLCCHFGAIMVWRCDESKSRLHCWMKM